jgi:hypothetical protein
MPSIARSAVWEERNHRIALHLLLIALRRAIGAARAVGFLVGSTEGTLRRPRRIENLPLLLTFYTRSLINLVQNVYRRALWWGRKSTYYRGRYTC